MIWTALHPNARPEMLGFIPGFLDENDPRPAREQFEGNYQHGGGWDPFPGLKFNANNLTLKYSGDPPVLAIAETHLRDERIILFEHSWVAIIQKDGTYEVSRMD